MEAATVYVKTSNGRAEVRSRERRLTPRERGTLIMIDGQRCLADLQRLSLAPDEVEHHLRAFLDAGLITPLAAGLEGALQQEQLGADAELLTCVTEASPVSPLPAADCDLHQVRLYVLEVAKETLGNDAAEFGDRLARSADTRELLNLAHLLREALNRFATVKEGDQFWETVREIAPKM